MSTPSVALLLSPDGQAVRVTAPAPDALPGVEPIKPELLDVLGRRVLGSGIGARIAVIPRAEWQALVAPVLLREDVALAAARAKHGRPAVCVAVHAAALQSPDDHRLLLQMAQACALALEALRTYAEEHMLALSLQRSFLPDRLPQVPGVALAVRYVPATSKTAIGGDFYEALETEHGLLVAIGDVVGHSLDAAIIMGEVRHALRAYAVEGHPPDVILGLLDRLVTRLRPDTLVTVTLCLLLVEPSGRRIKVSNAGHIPPLIINQDGDRFLPQHSALLGLGLDHPAPAVCEIEAPTRIVLITDGLVEVPGTVLTESLADFQAAARSGPADIEALCDRLLLDFGQNKDDDIALVVLDLS
jgi:serine phosphatase RsbU (regulator of sigma subunit)